MAALHETEGEDVGCAGTTTRQERDLQYRQLANGARSGGGPAPDPLLDRDRHGDRGGGQQHVQPEERTGAPVQDIEPHRSALPKR